MYILSILLVVFNLEMSLKVVLAYVLAVISHLNWNFKWGSCFFTTKDYASLFSATFITTPSLNWWIVMFYDSLLHLPKWVVQTRLFVFWSEVLQKETWVNHKVASRHESKIEKSKVMSLIMICILTFFIKSEVRFFSHGCTNFLGVHPWLKNQISDSIFLSDLIGWFHVTRMS
jgi:hypothetical protein